MISIIGLGLVKSSILVLYKNIFDVRKFRIVVYFVLAYVIGWTVSFTFSHLFTFYPITVFIEPYYGNSCVETVPMFLALLVSYCLTQHNDFDSRLTILPVHGCLCRHCHPYSSYPDGFERQNGGQEEASCNRNAFTWSCVSLSSSRTSLCSRQLSRTEYVLSALHGLWRLTRSPANT